MIVLQDIEQQRQESERKLASARLLQKQKKAEQYTQERKLCELKSQVGGLRVELQRFNSQLSLRHRELLEIQMKAENSRKDTHRFDAKLKREKKFASTTSYCVRCKCRERERINE